MKTATIIGAFLVLVSAVCSAREVRVPAQRDAAIVNASIIQIDDGTVRDKQTVVIRAGRIEIIGPSETTVVPPASERIDAHGQFLIPGLVDMHAHCCYLAPTHSRREREAAYRDDLLLYVANGVTTIRNMAGSREHLALRKKIALGNIVGPRLFTTGPVLETHPSFASMATVLGKLFKQVKTAEDAATEVRAEKKLGYDFVKIYNQIDASVYDAIIKTAAEQSLPVVGHVPIQPGLESAFQNHQASIEHLRGYDLELASDPKSTDPAIRFGGWPKATDAAIDSLVKRTVQAGTWNVPTLLVAATQQASNDQSPDIRAMGVDYDYVPWHLYADLQQAVLTSYYSADISDLVRSGLPKQCELIRKLVNAGGKVMVGTDALVPGIAVHGEIRVMHKCGLTPLQSLAAATMVPGQWFSQFAPSAVPMGLIKPGYAADLVLLRSNPLADVANLDTIAGVMVNGRWLDSNDISERLNELHDRSAPRIAKIKGHKP